MIVYRWDKYKVIKFPFQWFHVYEGSRLHAKFRYEASAVNYLSMKKKQELEWSEKK